MVTMANTVKEYIDSLPEDRKEVITRLHKVITTNLTEGYQSTINYKMIGYVVPHSIYPSGYHCDTKLPLPFMNLASQKNFVAVYHMGIYSNEELMTWFTNKYKEVCKYKLDMGKSCIRFKHLDDIPYELIGELCTKIPVKEWIDIYEKATKK